jgi:hypothetical protein
MQADRIPCLTCIGRQNDLLPRIRRRVQFADPRLHFGLGGNIRIEAVEVTWPSGRVDRHPGLEADTGYLLREGVTKVERWRSS